jgi:hypothetical protein
MNDGKGSRCGVGNAGREATVIGRWADDMALLRTSDGSIVEVSVPEHVRGRVDVGASVALLDDGDVNWHLG